MLTALAPSGPVAPPVPNSPPSTTDSTQPAGRESFKDVYGSISNGDDSKSDAGSKQKTTASTEAKPKKSSEEADNKTAVIAASLQQGIVVQKAPLAFAFPSLRQQDIPSEPERSGATEDQSQPAMQSTGDGAAHTALPDFGRPPAKADLIATTALISANEKLAFSARLTPPDAPVAHQAGAPRLSTPPPSRPQTSNDSRTMTAPPAAKDADQTMSIKATPTDAVLPVREIAAASAFDFRQAAPPIQPSEPLHGTPARSVAIQDVQPTLPEIPKPPTSTEILLHFAGQDQSSASVRVVDRSGTVNVTVHAADADLRNSLRSNLSDLASQLTGQGFKTDVVKPAVIAANADNQHDSRHSGQDSSGQQQNQSAQDGRQPQRDRRANSERWRDEFEQQASGTPGT